MTAGLRRHLGRPDLTVTDVQPVTVQHQRPSIGRVRGLKVDYRAEGEDGACSLVVKEPRGTTRAGLAGAGRREVGMYLSLATELPLRTPALIAAAPTGDWLVLEAVRPVRQGGSMEGGRLRQGRPRAGGAARAVLGASGRPERLSLAWAALGGRLRRPRRRRGACDRTNCDVGQAGGAGVTPRARGDAGPPDVSR